jgi:hypothetical protein
MAFDHAELDLLIAVEHSRPTSGASLQKTARSDRWTPSPILPIKLDVDSFRQRLNELEWIEWEFGNIHAGFPGGHRFRACVLDAG